MARKKKTQQQEQRDKLQSLYPDAVEYMKDALRDELKAVAGKKPHATVGQKLEIAKIIVDQVVGRPSPSSPIGSDSEQLPVTTLEVIKTYELAPGAPTPTSGDLIPVDDPAAGPTSREEWLQSVEEEALTRPKEPQEPEKTPRQLHEAEIHAEYLAGLPAAN